MGFTQLAEKKTALRPYHPPRTCGERARAADADFEPVEQRIEPAQIFAPFIGHFSNCLRDILSCRQNVVKTPSSQTYAEVSLSNRGEGFQCCIRLSGCV